MCHLWCGCHWSRCHIQRKFSWCSPRRGSFLPPPPHPAPSLVRMSLHTLLHTLGETGKPGALYCTSCSHIESELTQWMNNNGLKICLNFSHTDIMTIFLVSTSGVLALIKFQVQWSYRNLMSQLSPTHNVTVFPTSLRMSLVSTCVMGRIVHKAACYRL